MSPPPQASPVDVILELCSLLCERRPSAQAVADWLGTPAERQTADDELHVDPSARSLAAAHVTGPPDAPATVVTIDVRDPDALDLGTLEEALGESSAVPQAPGERRRQVRLSGGAECTVFAGLSEAGSAVERVVVRLDTTDG